MKEINLKRLQNSALLDLYADHVKWHHYEPVNEFEHLRDTVDELGITVSKSSLESELLFRLEKYMPT